MRLFILFSFFICLSACHTLTEQQPNSQSAAAPISIAHQRYQLDNGLTVILHQDHSDPLVHVDVTYHVGSAREQMGKSGFAHFFEHMMFQGSKNVADEQHFAVITEAGGELNGSTNTDRTNYYQTVPNNQLEKVLWLEADRMGFLLEAVTQEKFEVQRDTVKNERGQNYDNRPYGLRNEKNSEALYPAGHPYSWSTIGYVEDLDRVKVEDLKAFFQRWYGPNNAVLTIGGDIDITQTKRWIAQYFGPIARGPEVENAAKQPAVLSQDRYVTHEDKVHLPLLQLTFPTVYARHKDEAALDILADILGGGKTSLLYKNLVKDGAAVQAMVSHPCRELACEFQLIALANPQQTPNLAVLNDRIQQSMLEFERRGVQPDDLNRTKAAMEASSIFALQSVAGKVSALAANQTFYAEADLVQQDLDRYNAVSAEDVMRVYQTYIKGKAKVVLSIVPQGQPQLAAHKANFQFQRAAVTAQAPQVEQPSSFATGSGQADDFDRSQVPPSGEAPVINMPEYWRQDMPNGITMLGLQTGETPTVSLTLSLEGGPLLDPIEKAGLASLTAQMMNESTTKMSNEQLANQLSLLGSSIHFSAQGRFTQVRVSSLSKNFAATLALLQQKLFHPAFLAEDFQRLQGRTLQSMQQQIKNPAVLAERATSLLLFGRNNRVSLPDSGTIQSFQTITLDDVQQFYQRYYSPIMAKVVVVGDISKQQVMHQLAFLKDWQGKAYRIPDYQSFPQYQQSKLYVVDYPGAAQSVVKILRRGLPYDATGRQFRSKLMNFPLGGMFNSRINLNLREDKGYTYGAGSSFGGGKTLGSFTASANLKKQHTADGIAEMLYEIENYRANGASQDELAMMRSAYTQGDALGFETPSNKAGFLRHLLTYDLDSQYRLQQRSIINDIRLSEINQLAKEELDTEKMQIVVVGDMSVLRQQLTQLDRPIEMLELVP